MVLLSLKLVFELEHNKSNINISIHIWLPMIAIEKNINGKFRCKNEKR
jgi:hypothetical protein